MPQPISDRDTQQAPEALLVIDSCHSTWLFDEANHRFRRMVKGLDEHLPVTTDWRPYDRLVIEESSDAFLVFLDRSSTRLLRSRRHLGAGCDRCLEEATSELSLRAIADFPAAALRDLATTAPAFAG
ncbi:MAG TPA: hypothetical protein VNF07_12330 [Acidimicrobiales bacterium]|nr:hypothetical protein [Acidimicrobiales bacterium]